MPTRNQSHPVIYRAFNSLAGVLQSGDVGNHQLAWSKDGILSTPTNAPQAVTGWDGWYYFWTTNAEANCEVGELIGRSTTGTHIHIERVRYFYQLDVALTTAGLAAVRADGLNVNLLSGQTVALTPTYQATLTTAIEAALLNDGDGQSLVEAIIMRIESDLDSSDVSVQAIAVAVRNAILDRILAGNHTTAGSVGAQLLKVDTLMLADSYVEPDNEAMEGALEAATSAAAGVLTLQQRFTDERAENLDLLPGIAEGGSGGGGGPIVVDAFHDTALAQLQRKVGQAVTVSPVSEDHTITIVVGDSYLGEDGRKITLTQRISNNELNIAGWTIRIHWTGGITTGSLVGEVLVPTGRIAVTLEFTAEQTALIAGTYDYVIDATNEDGRRITLFNGKLRAVSYPRAT